jgi:hypothetical protein
MDDAAGEEEADGRSELGSARLVEDELILDGADTVRHRGGV